MIIVDSLRQDHLGAYGNQWIQTPNLDAFAKESVVFNRCYSDALPTGPVRRALHTANHTFPYHGYRSWRGNATAVPGWSPIPDEHDTISEILVKEGYRTALITDTFHLFKPWNNFHRGFDFWEWIRGQENDRINTGPPVAEEVIQQHLNDPARKIEALKWFLNKHLMNTRDRKGEEDHFCAKVFRKASNWLYLNQDAEKFFMMIDSFDPHEAWDPPKYYRRLYDRNEDTADLIMSPYNQWEGLGNEKELKRLQANYAGTVTMLDRWFGHFIDDLKLNGRIDNTVVALISDHGHSLALTPGDRNYMGKQGHPISRSIADLVMMVRHPEGQGAGQVRDTLLYNLDLTATLMGLLGIEPKQKKDGIDFWPAVKEPERSFHDHITIGWSTNVSVINDKWWYNASIFGEEPKLYDLENDFELITNLAKDEPGICEEMRCKAVSDAGGSDGKPPEQFEKFRRDKVPATGLGDGFPGLYGSLVRQYNNWRN